MLWGRGDAGDAMEGTFEKVPSKPPSKLSTHGVSETRLALRFSFWWLEASVAYVATLCLFSVVRIYVVYSKKYLSTGTERHMGRSLQVSF